MILMTFTHLTIIETQTFSKYNTHINTCVHVHTHTIRTLLSTHRLGGKRVWQTSYSKVVSDICQTKHTLTLGAVPAVGCKLLLRPRPHFGTS